LADHYWTVSLPDIALDRAEGERIKSVEVIINCARFTDIHSIPDDWSVEVGIPLSEVSTFKAGCGHGSSSLWSSRDLDSFITIVVCEPSCFTIRAIVTASTRDKDRTFRFTRSELIIKAALNKSSASRRKPCN
jgi:hypothetical protein